MQHPVKSTSSGRFWYTFSYSKFSFYIHKQLMNNNCTDISFFNNTFFFKKFYGLWFINENVYSKNICPYIFLDSTVHDIKLHDFRNTFFSKNYLTFKILNKSIDINSTIKYLFVQYAYMIDIDLSILNRQVFQRTEVITIMGHINNIESNIFDSFHYVRKFHLITENFKTMKTKKFFNWSFLPSFPGIDFNKKPYENILSNNLKRVFYFGIDTYGGEGVYFKHEDFCIYKDFPFRKLVFPIIYERSILIDGCSCTALWLIQDKIFLKKYFDFSQDTMYFFEGDTQTIPENCLHNSSNNCNYSSMISNCFDPSNIYAFHDNEKSIYEYVNLEKLF